MARGGGTCLCRPDVTIWSSADPERKEILPISKEQKAKQGSSPSILWWRASSYLSIGSIFLRPDMEDVGI